MQKLPPEEPIDILADAAPDIPMEESSPLHADVPGEKPESEEMQESVSKKYRNADVYKMISLVLRYPSGGHGGETFWSWMVKIYGNTLLEGRNGSGLRNRWRKILKEHPSGLDEYKKTLAESLCKDVVNDIEKKIELGVTDLGKLGLSNKAYSTLFPNVARPLDHKDADKGTRKKKLEDGNAEIVHNEEKKKPKRGAGKNYFDLEQLLPKNKDIPRFVCDNEISGLEAKIQTAKNLVIIKNINDGSCSLKPLGEMGLSEELKEFKKLDDNLSDFFQGPIPKGPKRGKQSGECTEIEDLALRQSENTDMINWLIKTKGEVEVIKRKKQLGLL